MATELKTLKLRRGSIKTQLTCFNRFFDKIKNLPDSTADTVSELETRLIKIEQLWDNFNDIQTEIEINCDDVDEQAAVDYREEFQDVYFKSIGTAKQFISKFNAETCDNQSHHSGVSQISQGFSNIKLPTINLPTFDGEFTQWRQFYDTFIAIVHSNVNISDAQKFCYLRASLKGQAANLIQSFETSDANYSIAFDLLKERYDNRRRIIHTHARALLDLKNISKDNHVALRQLIDTVQMHLRCLESLGQPVDHWGAFLVPLIASKLSPETNKSWESKVNSENSSRDEIPTISELLTFLTYRQDTLEAIYVDKTPAKQKEQRNVQKSFLSAKVACAYCNGSHSVYNCGGFKKLTVNARVEQVKKLKLCINCLTSGHVAKECKSISCKKCDSKHSTLLHFDRPSENLETQPEATSSRSNQATPDDAQVSLLGHVQTVGNFVLLATASITIYDKKGIPHTCRALLDSGSQSNFITTKLCDILGVVKRRTSISIVGINNTTASNTNYSCNVTIRSRTCNFSAPLSCIVLPQICENLPSRKINISHLEIPQHINLADPDFNCPSQIDLLLGADFFWQVICVGQIKLGHNKPILQKSKFGWLLSGRISTESIEKTLCSFSQNVDIQNQLSKFWEIEECSTEIASSSEEKLCESHFINTVKRNTDGRFVVSIPLKDSLERLGDSKTQAQKRFYSLERKLQRNPILRDRYTQFMSEYESMNHMTRVSDTQQIEYYMPHHGVIKEDSITTKLRVVFDGSCQSSSGYSVNDLQMVGPTIQQDLLSILLRFRQHAIVISADIAKMYRQILVTPEQRIMQRIFWRSDPTQPLSSYELNTVTYGTAAASFLAIRCLHQLSLDNTERYPTASRIIRDDFYVDDMLTGADSIDEVAIISKQVSDILKQGCFELRKWVSNVPEVLQRIPSSGLSSEVLEFGSNENTKTLGLLWSCESDNLAYKITNNIISKHVTKRSILSSVAQIFDPLGLLSASTISAKILLQHLWQEKLSWDESVPLDIYTKWLKFRENIHSLQTLKIPRRVICNNPRKIEIHCFSDASEAAYGACVYLRSIDHNGHIFVRLICAKSKVAPLKIISVPRLELCGALISARLFQKVYQSLTVKFDRSFYWSDSTVVLGWIKTPANLLKTFVANRVSEIQDKTNPDCWRHVGSKDNPADLLSRGVPPNTLENTNIWWSGPSWLSRDDEEWPTSNTRLVQDLPELKIQVQSFATTTHTDFDILTKYSSLIKLQNIVAYCFRFYFNLKQPKDRIAAGPITVAERSKAMNSLIRLAQAQCFEKEISCLAKANQVKPTSRLSSLKPFSDENGILRVGGRLGNSNHSFNKCHPIVLPPKNALTKLILQHEHKRLLHCGPQALLNSIHEAYWPISGRNIARQVVRQCVTCFRNNPKAPQSYMGDLPQARITPSPPFYNCGVDYAGPFLTRDRRARGYKTYKAYICIFVCFVTKAIHLELVSDLTTDCFLASLRRFVSRRGKPANIYSDNGTNFVGASNELRNLGNFISKNTDSLVSSLSQQGITWHFIPAHSPHFGGLWEAGVKSVKHHLKRVMGNALLTFEDFNTLLTQIEAILNSRPLSPASSDPNDLQPLTPAHFLIGRSLTSVADPDVRDISENRLSRYQRLQQVNQHFWARWSKEYISQLQQRGKWRQGEPDIHVGSMVILKDDNLPPLSWRMGRITALHPGSDGITRVVSVKTNNGIVKRSVVKICIFPIQNEQSIHTDHSD